MGNDICNDSEAYSPCCFLVVLHSCRRSRPKGPDTQSMRRPSIRNIRTSVTQHMYLDKHIMLYNNIDMYLWIMCIYRQLDSRISVVKKEHVQTAHVPSELSTRVLVHLQAWDIKIQYTDHNSEVSVLASKYRKRLVPDTEYVNNITSTSPELQTMASYVTSGRLGLILGRICRTPNGHMNIKILQTIASGYNFLRP